MSFVKKTPIELANTWRPSLLEAITTRVEAMDITVIRQPACPVSRSDARSSRPSPLLLMPAQKKQNATILVSFSGFMFAQCAGINRELARAVGFAVRGGPHQHYVGLRARDQLPYSEHLLRKACMRSITHA